jgi:hypothetical protein
VVRPLVHWSPGAPILEVKVDDIPIRPLLSLSLDSSFPPHSCRLLTDADSCPFFLLSSLDSSSGVLAVPHQMQRRLSSFS